MPASIHNGSDEVSDWEYEYDQNETEDVYFTLDLPPPQERPFKRRKTNPQPEPTPQPVDASVQRPPSPSATAEDSTQSQPLRFQGLHTTSPYVEYNDQQYDCRWTTDLGTQFYITPAGLTKHPLRPGHVVDLVAVSRVRLTGSYATEARPLAANGDAEEDAIVLDEDMEGDDREDASHAKKDDQPQLSFLERIAEVQRQKAKVATSLANINDRAEPAKDRATSRSSLNEAPLGATDAVASARDCDLHNPPNSLAGRQASSENLALNGNEESKGTFDDAHVHSTEKDPGAATGDGAVTGLSGVEDTRKYEDAMAKDPT